MNVLDLFSGIGGFSLGLERAGMRTVAFCEIDPFCRAVLKKHWPNVPCYDDITTLTAARLAADGIHETVANSECARSSRAGRDTQNESKVIESCHSNSEEGRIDLICGGFPCQDISVAGKGAGIKGTRSGLWNEYARIIGEVRPRWVIIENVSGLLSGSDEYELPNDRCLCGWPYRWRGVHQHRASQRKSILSQSGCGNGIEGSAGARGPDGEVWRLNSDNTQEIGEMGGSKGLATIRPTTGSISESDIAASSVETGTCTAGIESSEDGRLSTEEAEWFRFVDGQGNEGCESHSGLDDGIKSQGTAAFPVSRMVCEACGRDLGDAATRSGHSTWMGRILRDLAALGFDAEWHCIPASAIGAPHRRDRVWIVAYRDPGQHIEQNEEIWSGRNAVSNGSEAVADPKCRNGETQRENTLLGKQERERPPTRLTNGHLRANEQWFVEPNVGRVAHGVPAELDGSGNEKEHTQEAGTKGDENNNGLSGVWGDGEARETSSRLLHARIGASLMSFLSHQSGSAGWNQTQESNADLQTLRQEVFANTQQKTHALQSRMPRDCWPHECGEALGQIWSQEPDIGRIAHGVQNRVDRLRSLGNAIVPQIAEIIGRAIMEIENEMAG